MKVSESQDSLRNRFMEMVRNSFPGYVVPVPYLNHARVIIRKSKSGILGLLGIDGSEACLVDPEWDDLFSRGAWEDIRLQVFLAEAFENAKALASAFEKETAKEITVIKRF